MSAVNHSQKIKGPTKTGPQRERRREEGQERKAKERGRRRRTKSRKEGGEERRRKGQQLWYGSRFLFLFLMNGQAVLQGCPVQS
jgi:hypothetical protein